LSRALFFGILEGSQREIKLFHHGDSQGTEKSKSFLCPDESSEHRKGVSLAAATDSNLRDRKLDSVIEQIMPVQDGISPQRRPS
jgi:hypothetical protein